jgi:hypothetical protein
MIDDDRIQPDRLEIRLPPIADEPAGTQLAVRCLADAARGESIVWPVDELEGWRIIEHLALQIPGATISVKLPGGGELTTGTHHG